MHQYIKITEIDKQTENTNRRIPGAVVMCAMCGEVKSIWIDGTQKIDVAGDDKCNN